MTPTELVALLSPTTPDLSARIKCVDAVSKEDGTKIEARFFYVPFRNSQPTIDDLIDVAHARMVNFAIPRERILEAISEMVSNPGSMDPFVLLTTEARDLFIKTREETGRSGELGEMLLYMLVEWVLKAPIVACKMYLKTAMQMPVHGTDGIHLGAHGDNIVIYWGESKLHDQLSTGITDSLTSIWEYVGSPEKYKNEVRIIRTNMNFGDIDVDAKKALKTYFNPYKTNSNNISDRFACLVGFDAALYKDLDKLENDKCEVEFLRRLKKRIEDAFPLLVKHIKDKNMNHLSFSYFLMPFPSVDKARQKFQERLWGRQ